MSKTKHLTFISKLHTLLAQENLNPIAWEIRSIASCNSTNDYSQYLFELNHSRNVVLSRYQERGRGREQRVWESPEGGIWMSIGLDGSYPVQELSTPVVHAVHKLLSTYIPNAKCEVKDPNDVLVNGLKMAGILVESKIKGESMEKVVIGIGINIENELPESIQNLATRLVDHTDDTFDMYQIAAEIVVEVIKDLDELGLLEN